MMNIDRFFHEKLKGYRRNPSNDIWLYINAQLDAEASIAPSDDAKILRKKQFRRSIRWTGFGLLFLAAIFLTTYLFYSPTQAPQAPQAPVSTFDDASTVPLVAVSTDNNAFDKPSRPSVRPSAVNISAATSTTPSSSITSSVSPAVEFTPSPIAHSRTTSPSESSSIATPPETTVVVHQSEPITAPASTPVASQLSETALPISPETPVPDEVLETLTPLEKEIETTLRIPNFITPNGDGQNDYFRIDRLVDFPHNEIEIFTRRGKVVYRSKPYTQPWDGGNVAEGVYFYILKIERGTEKAIRRGVIHVLR